MQHQHKEKRTVINAKLTVVSSHQLSNSFIRVCFKSDKQLAINPLWIGPHLKLLFPDDKTDEIIFPTRDENNKIIWQQGVRSRVRTYSIRHYDVSTQQLIVDFAIHQHGIASTWAQCAQVGQQIGLLGMGSKREFSDHHLVLVGDISAMPAICYTIEHLPDSVNAVAVIEVNDSSDKGHLQQGEHVIVNWLVREKNQPSQLINKVMNLQFDSNRPILFWGGMEGLLAQQMRHQLKDKYPSLPSDAIQIINYWRDGFAEGEFSHRD